ncbi:type I-C CRISPR-associated protein Cas8c/Csd1 [Plantactinospora endophytica]|uniref:Type I-C CRISPR-associated protein Cas8c/Csd1 n=1 Tax=Plantactinospora endophytica TaxID=673535 RepID=A0ABQ4EEC4_9ACTN|nr:type I-C CRISPR-associated protein Cas8c/Csd1 [Plantactinospora endophytica]GIG93071.1 type I-C CRISPR-associated protein Cas8c/Csd1 [Plantactinospora endophytica]
MLLQRLVQFQRPREDAAEAAAARPYSRQRIVRWQLNLDHAGRFTRLVDLADPSDRSTRFGRPILVPNGGRTSGIAPCPGADDAQYVLGWRDEKSKHDRVTAAHNAFIALARRWLREHPDEPAARALVAFCDRREWPQPPQDAKWASKDLMIIAVAGRRITERDSLWELWQNVVRERKSGAGTDGDGRQGHCLVCDRDGTLLDRMPQTLPKALVPRAEQDIALVSANRRIHTYDFNEGLVGSPICVACGQAAVANLSTILSDERFTFSYPRQRTRLAWWATDGADSDTIRMLDERPERISNYLHTLALGRQRRRPGRHQFCSVTLSGNVSRLMVHQWLEMPLTQAESNVETWFRDHQILNRGQDEPSGYPIWLLVLCAGQWATDKITGTDRYIPFADKAADRPDDLAQLLLHSGLNGGTLPPHVLAHTVRRIRTDLRVDGPRAALLRVALNRHPHRNGEGPAAVLDEEQDNPAYLHGRLFAVLESLQRRAYPGDGLPNTTFFHRYFAGAVTNPRVALVQGCQLSPAWLKKLDGTAQDRGNPQADRDRAAKAAYRFRERLRELHDRLNEPVKPLADAESQSWFVLGYFQQQAHDIRMARAGKAPEVPTDDLSTNHDGPNTGSHTDEEHDDQ